jgi:hypothetical protein
MTPPHIQTLIEALVGSTSDAIGDGDEMAYDILPAMDAEETISMKC